MYKAIKKLKGECPICEDITNLSYGTKSETLTINNQKINVTSKVYRCEDGKHFFYDPVDEENKFQDAYRKYRQINGLLQPEEIKEIRKKYGLSQRALARFLGWGEITIQRYESGAIQDNAHNIPLLLIKETSNFEKFYEKRKEQLDAKDIRKINKHLDEIKQLTLFSAFREGRKYEVNRSNLKLIRHLQSVGDYKYSIPIRTSEGELALAS
ncbi:MAG TPA: helix-turn-helix domain-containing protein [Nitrospirae bacterium]|nr:helix-turn-helix domain-containing protein [Nitrospirota bacterium]HDZ02282.1 helix-turn-helix domain-containing protein [Nitrospirota bacterium]